MLGTFQINLRPKTSLDQIARPLPARSLLDGTRRGVIHVQQLAVVISRGRKINFLFKVEVVTLKNTGALASRTSISGNLVTRAKLNERASRLIGFVNSVHFCYAVGISEGITPKAFKRI